MLRRCTPRLVLVEQIEHVVDVGQAVVVDVCFSLGGCVAVVGPATGFCFELKPGIHVAGLPISTLRGYGASCNPFLRLFLLQVCTKCQSVHVPCRNGDTRPVCRAGEGRCLVSQRND